MRARRMYHSAFSDRVSGEACHSCLRWTAVCRIRLARCWLACAGLVLGAATPLLGGDTFTHSKNTSQRDTQTRSSEQEITDARCALETLRSSVEEWGTLTVSEPMVVFDTGQFDLGKNIDTTTNYVARARGSLQGGATQAQSTGVGNSLNLQVTPTFSVDLAGNKTALPSGSATPDPNATPPPLTASGETAPTVADPGKLLRSAAAAGVGGDKPSGFENSDAIAVPIGESAKITELLGAAMAHPALSRFTNPDVTVHFAIVQVSCNPGWRTRENYIGDVTATCEFYRSTTQTVQPEGDPIRPLVFSVLPLFDAQTLELASSERQLTQLVAQITAAYPTSAVNLRASDLIKLTKQYQSDVATRTPRTVTNSYSAGSSFGFRFAPSLVALRDPAQRHSGAANILQATSFPALVTIIVNSRHAYDKKYNSVLVHLAHHWFINDRPPLRNFWQRWAMPLKRDRIDGDYQVAFAVDRAQQAIYGLPDLAAGNGSDGPILGPSTPANVAMLYRQYQELRTKATGSSHPVFSFPLPPRSRQARGDAPIISEVIPNRITRTGSVALIIRGFNFFAKEDYQVWLGQRPGRIKAVRSSASGDQMFVIFDAASEHDSLPEDGTLSLILVGPHGMDAKPDAVEIVKSAATDKPAATPTPAKQDEPAKKESGQTRLPEKGEVVPTAPTLFPTPPDPKASASPTNGSGLARPFHAPADLSDPIRLPSGQRDEFSGLDWDPTIRQVDAVPPGTQIAAARQVAGDSDLPLP